MTGFDPNTSSLAGVDKVTLRQWLTDAQTAYNMLMSGAKVVSVGYGEKNVTYSQSSMVNLQQYIALLQAQLGLQRRTRRALRPFFAR